MLTSLRSLPRTATRLTRAMSSYNYGRMDDKVVVVAGAGNPPAEGHGIGSATALTLARHGATVISVSNVAENCQTVTDIINEEGLKGFAHTADCTSHDEAEALHERVVKDFGRCDVLINAGIHSALPLGFDKMTESAWETGIGLNLNAHFNLCHTFLPTFLQQESGNIIHFTSIASSVSLGVGKQRHAYAAGKAAAAILTRRLGVENAAKGVRGNVVAIGYISGPLVNRAVANAGADIEKVTATRDSYLPRQKQGTPFEVASIAAFLASDASSLINGTEVFADGGNHSCTFGP